MVWFVKELVLTMQQQLPVATRWIALEVQEKSNYCPGTVKENRTTKIAIGVAGTF
jgi:hypothetical protein